MACALGLVALGIQTHSPMWFMWAALTFAIGGGKWSHPEVVIPDRPVLWGGRLTGLACVVVFALTFVPRPFG
jgi:hypothetical protein